MMLTLLTSAIPLLLLVLAALLLGPWALTASRGGQRLEGSLVRAGFWLGMLFALWLIVLGVWQGAPPVVTPGQLLATLAGLIWLGHVYTQRRIRQHLLTVIPLATVVVLLFSANLFGLRADVNLLGELASPRASLHIILSLAAVTLLIGSGVFGAGSLILHRQIKGRRFGAWFHHLPSLHDMQRLRVLTLTSGWALITVSVVGGLTSLWLAPEAREATISHLHPMLLLWGALTILWLADLFRWLARQAMALASLAMSVVMVVLLVISVVEFFAGGAA